LKWATDYEDNDDDVEGDNQTSKSQSVGYLQSQSDQSRKQEQLSQQHANSSPKQVVSAQRDKKKSVILTFWSSMSVHTVPLIFD